MPCRRRPCCCPATPSSLACRAFRSHRDFPATDRCTGGSPMSPACRCRWPVAGGQRPASAARCAWTAAAHVSPADPRQRTECADAGPAPEHGRCDPSQNHPRQSSQATVAARAGAPETRRSKSVPVCIPCCRQGARWARHSAAQRSEPAPVPDFEQQVGTKATRQSKKRCTAGDSCIISVH